MRIVVGITGGIAAYKVPQLVRLLVKQGHEVRCAATAHALQFVTRPVLETLSHHPLYSDLFASGGTEHISLKDWAEAVVVAPATANIIGKMCAGIADDALSTLLLASMGRPMVVCPAMNSDMWASPAVQRNIATLREWGVRVLTPAEGELACGATGTGRMAEPEQIALEVENGERRTENEASLSAQKWLVTAGPTYERIDSVRFIGNYSSGKMGFALAEALAEAGADVELVAGPTALNLSTDKHFNGSIHLRRVESAREMYAACTALWPECRGAVLAAAVADYRPESAADHKLKKQGSEGMTLRLVQNPDILATLGAAKREGQRLVGFALETDHEEANALGKLQRKNLDFIVLNSLRDAGAGFGVDTNKVLVLGRDGFRADLPLAPKADVARMIVKTVTS